MENLLKRMDQIVEEKVEGYKTDLKLDVIQIRKNINNKYLWIPYNCGTNLIPLHKVLYKDDFSKIYANQYLNYNKNEVWAYILEIKEVKRKNFYGEITEINPRKALKILNEYQLEYDNFSIEVKNNKKKVITTITKEEEEKYNGRILDILYTKSESEEIFDKLKIKKEEIYSSESDLKFDFLHYEPYYKNEEEELLTKLKKLKIK